GTVLADAEIGDIRPVDVSLTQRFFGPLARIESTTASEFLSNQIPLSDAPSTSRAQPVAAPEIQSPWIPISRNDSDVPPGWTGRWFEDCTGADQIWLADNQTRAAWAWSFFIGGVAAGWT